MAKLSRDVMEKKLKILLVEDDIVDRMAVTRELSHTDWHIDIQEANDVKSGLDALTHEAFDCVLLDYLLPDKSGIDFIKESQLSYNTRVPIIMLAGNSNNELALKVIQEGAQDYLIKDEVNGPLLLRSIRHSIERYHLISELATSNKQLQTEIKERKQLEIELKQAEKMEAIGQLAGGIAHDFNNQLAGIMGYADLLRLQLKDDRELLDYAINIIKSARRSADLTAKLLAFARKGKYQIVPIDIHSIVKEVITFLSHSIDKKITIKSYLDAKSAIIEGDPTLLQNALLNLSLNSRDAMPNGGELIFGTKTAQLGKDFCQSISYEMIPGKYLVITVTDSGIGMDRETQKSIFEPFFTTKKLGKGTGMGLAAVYGTIKNHKGAINVYSEIGHGTTFNIYLPVSVQNLLAETENDSIAEYIGSARILLVDDDEVICKMTSCMLTKLGNNITTRSNGRTALEYYTVNWKNIDLVILDMVMPEMNAMEAFSAMRKINPEIKVILSSGYSLNGDVQKIIDKGVIDFIQKPYIIADLSKKIATVLNNK